MKVRGIPSCRVTSHSGQLSLLPSAELETITGQGAVVVPYGWEGNLRLGVTLAWRHKLRICSLIGD